MSGAHCVGEVLRELFLLLSGRARIPTSLRCTRSSCTSAVSSGLSLLLSGRARIPTLRRWGRSTASRTRSLCFSPAEHGFPIPTPRHRVSGSERRCLCFSPAEHGFPREDPGQGVVGICPVSASLRQNTDSHEAGSSITTMLFASLLLSGRARIPTAVRHVCATPHDSSRLASARREAYFTRLSRFPWPPHFSASSSVMLRIERSPVLRASTMRSQRSGESLRARLRA